MSDDPSSYIANLVVLKLKVHQRGTSENNDVIQTVDIFREANSSSLIDIEKLFVCWPIWILSPRAGANISFVMARILAQLSIRSSAASVGACTII
jgi:hypothetical protein